MKRVVAYISAEDMKIYDGFFDSYIKWKSCKLGDEYDDNPQKINDKTYKIMLIHNEGNYYMVWEELLDKKERSELSNYCTCYKCSFKRCLFIFGIDLSPIVFYIIDNTFLSYAFKGELYCLQGDTYVNQIRINSSRELMKKLKKE